MSDLSDLFSGIIRLSRFRRPRNDQNLSIGSVIANLSAVQPHKPMISTEHELITWRRFNERANQYAHTFKARGVVAGERVSILMENEWEMLAAMVGVVKLGAVAGLINIQLRQSSLIHCIETLQSQRVVFSSACTEAVREIQEKIESVECLAINTAADKSDVSWACSIDEETNKRSVENPKETQSIEIMSPAYCIFTSGTTGMPKAAIVTHFHWYLASSSFSKLLIGLKPEDRIYVCLPLFHTAAMLIGFGATCVAGSSFHLAKKFSVSNFWKDVKHSNSNVFLYIGELCRYLLNSPITSEEQNNPLKCAVGNGLRPELWKSFKSRFEIKKVAEYYGSTEGNLAFMNVFNRNFTFGMGLGKFKVLKCDELSGELVRDHKGYCIPSNVGEVGLLVNEISKRSPFNGYTDKTATQNKTLNDVLITGDQYFNTGDLIRKVDVGFSFFIPHFQFVDRVGDSFRWKGENVSTSEVSEVINAESGISISCVYGVQIPTTEGRACMAAIIVDESKFCIKRFAAMLEDTLPSYAQPVFVRIISAIAMTETFKIKKQGLQSEAFDLQKSDDLIYVKAPDATGYKILTADYAEKIQQGLAGF